MTPTITDIAVAASAPAPRRLTATEELAGAYCVLCELLHDQLGYAAVPSGHEARDLLTTLTTTDDNYSGVPDAALASRLTFALRELLGRVGVRSRRSR